MESCKWDGSVLPFYLSVNLPDGILAVADMNQKVYRHLVEQRWRNWGDLDLLVRCSNPFCSLVI